MEPPERGTLVHAILEEYLLERLAGAPRSLPRLLAVAETQFDRPPRRRGLVGKALLWRMDKAAIRRDLARFHDEEGDLEPVAAELEFGTGADGADPAVTVALDDGLEVRFKGKADRVDRARVGRARGVGLQDGPTGDADGADARTPWPAAGSSSCRSTPWRPRPASAATSVRARYWLLSEKRGGAVLQPHRHRRGRGPVPRRSSASSPAPWRPARFPGAPGRSPATGSSTTAGSATSTSCARSPGTGSGRARAAPPGARPGAGA